MPRGVNEKFLRILHHERRARLRAAAVMVALVPVAYFMAELVDEPLWGAVVVATLVAILAGTLVGVLLAHRRTRLYNESLLERWNAWQRAANACTRVDELARHADEKDARAPLAGVGWTSLFALNVVLFAALWLELSWSLGFGAVVALVNGIVVGLLLGAHLWTARWTRQFRKALDELASEGQLSYWGEV